VTAHGCATSVTATTSLNWLFHLHLTRFLTTKYLWTFQFTGSLCLFRLFPRNSSTLVQFQNFLKKLFSFLQFSSLKNSLIFLKMCSNFKIIRFDVHYCFRLRRMFLKQNLGIKAGNIIIMKRKFYKQRTDE
jgi:hypothetical protein